MQDGYIAKGMVTADDNLIKRLAVTILQLAGLVACLQSRITSYKEVTVSLVHRQSGSGIVHQTIR